MTLTQITTHEADALARLLEQFKNKPRIRGLISAGAVQVQELENAFFTILEQTSIYDAVGDVLDAMGQVVGIARPTSMSDAAYRVLVLAKVGQNVSSGETESVISMFAVLTGGRVRMEELFPAAVSLSSDGSIPAELGSLVLEVIKDSIAAGVRLGEVIIHHPTNAFSFAGGSDGGGFGDTANPATGGELADLIT